MDEVNFEKRGKLEDHQTCPICQACICDGHGHAKTRTIFAAIILCLSLASPAWAATFHCNNVPCLIVAMEQASFTTKKTRINLDPGTYTLQAVHNAIDGANGLPTVIGRIHIVGNAIIERDPGAPPFRLFHVSDGGQLTLQGLILQGGHDNSDFGGGAVANRGQLTLDDIWVRFNTKAAGPGLFTAGAAGIRNLGGFVAINNSLINDNEVADDSFVSGLGGGILNTNWFNFNGSMSITDTLIHNNTAGRTGGAIHNGANLVILRSGIFSNHTHSSGAGISSQRGAPLSVTRSTIALNDGGGIDGDNVTLTYSTLFGNENFDLALNFASPVLKGTIIGHCRGFPSQSSVQSQGFNVVQQLSLGCQGFGSSDLVVDPGLEAFDTDEAILPLLSNSPARGLAPLGSCPDRDQLGRKVKNGCDSGAVQFRRR